MEYFAIIIHMMVLLFALSWKCVIAESCNTSPEFIQSDACLKNLTTERSSSDFTDLLTVTFWESLCNQSYVIKQCLRESCGERYADKVHKSALQDLYSPIDIQTPIADLATSGCLGAAINEDINDMYQRARDVNCVNDGVKYKVIECMKAWLEEIWHMQTTSNSSHPEKIRQSVIRFGRSSFQCARNLVRTRCSPKAQDLLLYALNQTVPLELRHAFSKDLVDTPLTQTNVVSTIRDTVGVYGNTHLLVYNVSKPITCSLSGHVTFLTNQLFGVNGISRKIHKSGASIIAELEIEFYRLGGGIIGVYVADIYGLPGAFESGDTELGSARSPIEIYPEKNGRKIRINSTARAYMILIQKQAPGYIFSVRISEGVLKTSSGLLISGCSHHKKEVIDISSAIGRPETNVYEHCPECDDLQLILDNTEMNLTNTCLFDCILNGDMSSAKNFISDVIESGDYDKNLSLVAPPSDPGRPLTRNSAPHGLSCMEYSSIFIVHVVMLLLSTF